MTVGGRGLPRLQELAYLETVAKAAAAGAPFEAIRLSLVDHIWSLREASPAEPLDPGEYRSWRGDETKYVRNVTDALKELMRLGFLESSILPASGKSAYAHKDTTYSVTRAGEEWVERLSSDRRAAYDDLVPKLINAHPGFRCFLSVVGVMDTNRDAFVVPLMKWSELPRGHRSQQAYREAIGEYVAGALASSELGWRAEASEIDAAVNSYLDRVQARAQARGKDPFASNRAFTQTSEEALARLAFSKAGCPIDYISMEIARRWSRWLGLASFTYHAPGPYGLRFWSAATLQLSRTGAKINRRAGGEWRDRALIELHDFCQESRNSGTTYVPVWEARAAVSWKLQIVDDEFDRAIMDMIAGRRGHEFPWRVHLDQVSVGSIPSSAAPFVLTTAAAGTRNYNVITVVPKSR